MRESVYHFAMAMEAELKKNDHKGGWDGESVDWLLKRLDQEVIELKDAIRLGKNPSEVGEEAADVANFAMMISEVVYNETRTAALMRYSR